MANKVRITYNAPVTLNFSLVCALVLIMSRLIMPHLILVLFSFNVIKFSILIGKSNQSG